jgi:hypothetical protein
MPEDKRGPTPTGWTRNAAGFDEPPNTSPGLKTVLMVFGGIGAFIFATILIVSLVNKAS